MAASISNRSLHSAEYFGEQRDYWWNQDYIGLVAKRLNLSQARRVLDVGSGIGHWGRLILPHLDPGVEMIGVDREPQWVQVATQTAAAKGLSDRVRYQVGEAERLAFADGEFDLVTCQTLLLHVRDYRVVLQEMVRVLKPGGRLLVVEPNNLAGALLRASMGEREGLEDRLRLVRFQAICEYGKEQAGEGNNSTGDRLPGFFVELGLTDLTVYQSDHAYPMVPPYASRPEQVMKEQMIDWAQRDIWIWNESDAKRYFIAGGGPEEEFPGLWRLAMESVRRVADELRAGTYHAAGGSVVYVISAIKPPRERR